MSILKKKKRMFKKRVSIWLTSNKVEKFFEFANEIKKELEKIGKVLKNTEKNGKC